ncbi:MAG: hypothetical protein ABL982_24750 [Vicinamibacterales bacterium]
MSHEPKSYDPFGAPMVGGERPEPELPSNVVPLPKRPEVSRVSDEVAAYAELIAFIAANKDEDTECNFLPPETFAEGR